MEKYTDTGTVPPFRNTIGTDVVLPTRVLEKMACWWWWWCVVVCVECVECGGKKER